MVVVVKAARVGVQVPTRNADMDSVHVWMVRRGEEATERRERYYTCGVVKHSTKKTPPY